MPCRCLLANNFPDMAAAVAEYITLLPEEQRVADSIRRKRLDICLQCSHLRDGTCGLCGCYVEARSAKVGISCPDVPDRWKAISI